MALPGRAPPGQGVMGSGPWWGEQVPGHAHWMGRRLRSPQVAHPATIPSAS